MKAGAFQRGKDPPGNWFVPPSNNRSGGRGNEAVGAFDAKSRSSGDLLCSILPVLLELRRADVVQRRVHACSVIPEQPRNDLILGLADGLERELYS